MRSTIATCLLISGSILGACNSSSGGGSGETPDAGGGIDGSSSGADATASSSSGGSSGSSGSSSGGGSSSGSSSGSSGSSGGSGSSSGSGSSGGADAGCDSGTTCSGSCVDLQADSHNCGACGRDCTLCGGACMQGICAPTLLAPANEPNTLAIDATSIYWADNAPGGGVAKVALTGGTPTSLASGATNAFALAIDGTNAYVVSLDPVINADILSVPLAGGTFTTIATNMYTTVGTGNLLVTGGNIYWAQASSGAIMSVSAGGGTPATLVSMQPFPDAIGTDGSNLYWTVDGNGAVTGEPMAVLSAPLGGNTPSTLYSYAPYTGTFSDLAVGPQDLYWIANGAIQTIPHGGASSLTPISNTAGGSNPRLPTIDGSNIYWAESGSVTDTILMVPLAGGTPFTITTGAPRVQSIVIGASCVYWSYYTNLANGGAVYQVTK